MKSVFAVLVIFTSDILCDSAKFRCDYTYFPDAGGWFKLHRNYTYKREAIRICLREGGQLVSPTTDGVKDAVTSLMNQDSFTTAVHINILIPARTSTDESSEKLTSQVNSWIMTQNGDFVSVSQDLWYPFICHVKASEVMELNECGTTDKDYTLDARTGNCYKFHGKHKKWNRAYFTCSAEGGHLAIINSDIEAQAIVDLFAKNPPETIPGYLWNDSAFLGFGTWGGRNWITIEGQTLAAAGYDKFSPGEPNNANGNEFCGSVGRNGMLFDDPCNRKMPFICEKKRESPVCDGKRPENTETTELQR